MKQDTIFNTALKLYMKNKKKNRGRHKQSIILLDYRNWVIEAYDNFPSFNYIVKKKSDIKYRHVAYCSSLESALNQIYNIMLLENINCKNDYGAHFKDLKNVILQTKKQFTELLDVSLIIKAGIKRGDKQNDGC